MNSPNSSLRIALAQLNLLVGDVPGNAQKVIDTATCARDELGADLVVFPELTLTGYPPEDLLLRAGLRAHVERAIDRICVEATGITVLFGHPWWERGGLHNSATLISNGRVTGRYHKQHLPNYSVFDEKRYFVAGRLPLVTELKGVSVGVTICEDLWSPEPVRQAQVAGAQLLVNLNASPFHAGKVDEREQVARERAQENRVPIVYVNLVGGQDELVFDGQSFAVNKAGDVVERLSAWQNDVVVVQTQVNANGIDLVGGNVEPHPEALESIYHALVTGVRDYVDKNRFPGAVIGLSGGIDSALTLAIAVDALGADRVEAVMMPSRYTSAMSLEDARAAAQALGVEYRALEIEPAFNAFLDILQDEFAGTTVDTTEQNIQARCRGILLMAISNKKGKIVLTTGNKSEMAVGYATLYGDMAGGFAPIRDVPKLLVYRLSEYRNSIAPVIPQRIIDRPPSAELAPDQRDDDVLPPYETLDPILEAYVEQDRTLEEIVADGFDEAVVRRVITLVNRNEYKRRQAPPGVRITRRAFGRDRRYPITSAYLDTQLKG